MKLSSRDCSRFVYPCRSARWWSVLAGVLLLGRLAAQPVPPLLIDGSFTTQLVNDRVVVYLGSRPVPAPAASTAPADSRQVVIGPAYQYPQAWVYLPLMNTTNQPRPFIVDLDHDRCDTLDVYQLDSPRASPRHLTRLYRGLALARRPVPLRLFAIPFWLQPHQRGGLLFYSRRTTGVHQLGIRLSTPVHFVLQHEQDQFLRQAALTGIFFSLFTVLALGLVLNHRLLLYFGVYLLAFGLGQLSYNYFFDSFPFPAWLGLTANSAGLVSIFLANALFHPFGVAYLHHLKLYRRWHRYVVGVLVASTLFCIVLLLIPLTPFTNELVTRASLTITTLHTGWFFYLALLAWLKKREAYLLMTFLMALAPLLYWSYAGRSATLSYNHFQPLFYLLVLGYVLVSLFRRELSSRLHTQQHIQQVQLQLTQLRQAEIEQIGRNLHDQLGNTLAAALGYLSMQVPRVGLARDRLLDAIDQTRLISHNLVQDDARPLVQKLTDLAERFNDFSTIAFRYQDFTDGQLTALPPLKQQAIYLIVQEALTNVVRHSGAHEATIQSFVSENRMRLTIDDDGTGYTDSVADQGIGLKNMHKRAGLAGLMLTIDSGREGTLVCLETVLIT